MKTTSGSAKGWTGLPPARRRLLYLLVGLGVGIAALIVTLGDRMEPDPMQLLSIVGCGLGTLLCGLQTVVYWMERRRQPVSRFVMICMVLLTLILAGLTYDAIVMLGAD